MPSTSFHIRKGVALIAIVFSSAFAGAWLASLVEFFLGQIEYAVPPLYVVFPVLSVIAFLSMLAHEAGHVLGGWLAKFEFVLLVAGPLKIARVGNRLVCQYNKWLQMGGGLVLSVPQNWPAKQRDLFFFTVGGPFASLVMACACMILANYLYYVPTEHPIQGYTVYFVIFAALFNGGIALITWLPLPATGIDNDGKLLVDLMRGGRKAEIKLLGQLLSTNGVQGMRPGDWPQDQVQRLLFLTSEQEGKYAIMARLTAFYHFLDLKDISSAAACIQWIKPRVETSPHHIQPALQMEVYFFEALYTATADLNADCLSISKKAYVEKHTHARVESALLYRSGQFQEGIARAQEGIQLAKKGVLQAGIAKAEVEWMQAVITDCTSQLS